MQSAQNSKWKIYIFVVYKSRQFCENVCTNSCEPIRLRAPVYISNNSINKWSLHYPEPLKHIYRNECKHFPFASIYKCFQNASFNDDIVLISYTYLFSEHIHPPTLLFIYTQFKCVSLYTLCGRLYSCEDRGTYARAYLESNLFAHRRAVEYVCGESTDRVCPPPISFHSKLRK